MRGGVRYNGCRWSGDAPNTDTENDMTIAEQIQQIEDIATATTDSARHRIKQHPNPPAYFLANPIHVIETTGESVTDDVLAAAADMDAMLTVHMSINNWRRWADTADDMEAIMRKAREARAVANGSAKTTGPAMVAAWARYFAKLRGAGVPC